MNWTCEQTESRLSDYLDGLLQPGEQSAFDVHVSHCERCIPLVSGVGHLLTSLHSMEQLETPPRLVYAILDKTLGPRETVTGWRAVLAWVRMLATPRFAYGGASVMATFLILASASGFSWRKPKLADLRPVNVYRNADRSAHLVYARSAKYVSDLRVVYEIQSRLRQDEQIPTSPESTMPNSSPDKTPGRTDGGKPGQPKQQNRANDLERNLQMLAAGCPLLSDGRLP
jgi:anti-sigma factor RsiW